MPETLTGINKRYIEISEISNKNNIQMAAISWYPGHMTKARRQMQEDIKLIDLVIELVDARIPLSSRNPDIDELAKNKSRLIIMNKADLADDIVTAQWKKYFEEQDCFVLKVNSRNQADLKPINEIVKKACAEKIERDLKRGIKNRPVRAMVVGIPNVGKSTFINSYARKAVTKTGNKPGVTKGKQWIRLSSTLELLDTPGILWPKFEDVSVGHKLAMVGSIKDEIINIEDLALKLIELIRDRYPGRLEDFYRIADIHRNTDRIACVNQKQTTDASTISFTGIQKGSIEPERKPFDENGEETGTDSIGIIKPEVQTLMDIAKVRGCLLKGGEMDLLKASNILLENFRNGKLGKLSLESPI